VAKLVEIVKGVVDQGIQMIPQLLLAKVAVRSGW
jgi:hypothetical protein